MIFVDSNVFIYAVGRAHPLRPQAQKFFIESRKRGQVLVTSAEVLQELIHVYLPADRLETLDAALELAIGTLERIIPIDVECVLHARALAPQFPSLSARDLIHVSVCQIHGIHEIQTFDRGLAAVFRA